VSFIKSRLRRLEAAPRQTRRCPECGLRTQDKGYIVVDGKDPAGELPEVCPECGRYTRIRIVVVEEGEAVGYGTL
jgi:rRNA maturation protein Nop10